MSAAHPPLCLGRAVTFATHARLRAQSAPLLDAGPLSIDWADVETVDSSALALILFWRRRAQVAGHSVELHNLPRALLSLAALYGVEHFIAAA